MIPLYTAVLLTYTLPDSKDLTIYCSISHLHAAGQWWFPYTLRYYSPTRCWTVMIPLYTAVLLTYTLPDGDDSPIHCGITHLHAAGRWWFPYTLRYVNSPIHCGITHLHAAGRGGFPYVLRYEDSPVHCGMWITIYTAVLLTYTLPDGEDSPEEEL